VHAALLFATGVFVAIPVIRWRVKALEWLPLQVFRFVLGLMGAHAGLVRTAVVIWLFNSGVMFLYMASGFHQMLPKIFGIWVGMNVAIVTAVGGSDDRMLKVVSPREGSRRWAPSQALSWPCSVLVLAVELPAFWYSLAMGMSLGAEVQAGCVRYLAGFQVRALAFVYFILPALLVSAVSESIALRAAGGARGDGDGSAA